MGIYTLSIHEVDPRILEAAANLAGGYGIDTVLARH